LIHPGTAAGVVAMQRIAALARFRTAGRFPAAFRFLIRNGRIARRTGSRQGGSMAGNGLLNSGPTRRRFLGMAAMGAASAALSACVTSPPVVEDAGEFPPYGAAPGGIGDPALMYAEMEDDGVLLPAIPYQRIDPQFYRQIVDDPTG
jgi:hypothetical protein